MKKTLTSLACIATLAWAGSAFATPFQIESTDVFAGDYIGKVDAKWTSNMSRSIDLGEGESFEFNFGTFSFGDSLAIGEVNFKVNFASPNLENDNSIDDNTAVFFVASTADFTGGLLAFDRPKKAKYSYGGGPLNGVLELDLYSLLGMQDGRDVEIWGSITNVKDASGPVAAPVPEPGTVMLMGIGLAGLVAARRKKDTQA